MNELTDSAVKHTKIAKEWLDYMKEPKAVVTVKFPVQIRGEFKTIMGTRIIHSNHVLPTKGGLRFSIENTQDDLEALANLMSYKASLHDIPFGGAKGCIFIDPLKYSYEEKVRIVRRYTVEMWKRSMIKPSTDVMNPDIGTDEKMMNIIRETYKEIMIDNDTYLDAVVTGKSEILGGIGVSKIAAGYGVANAAKYVQDNITTNKILSATGLGSGRSKKSVIIQGFGVVGLNLAKFLVNQDFKIVGMTDEDVGCFNQMGFNPEEIYAYKKKHNGLHGISRTLNKPEDVLTQKCDIFISSQKECIVTKNLAENLKCKLLIEASNAPCTIDALEVLKKRNILVIPDLVSYSGGFIVSYLEWLKNIEHKNLTLLFRRFDSSAKKKLVQMLSTCEVGDTNMDYHLATENELVLMTIDEIMDSSFKQVLDVAQEHDIDLKTASFKIAIQKMRSKFDLGESIGSGNIY